MKQLKFKVGDQVWINGKSYQSANGTLIHGTVEKKHGEIKKAVPLGIHPYAISGIEGWFNEVDIKEYKEPEVKIKDRVRLINQKTYNGLEINFPLQTIYIVSEVDNDIATIRYGKNSAFQVSVYNLKKV